MDDLMMSVTIYGQRGYWILCIANGSQVIRSWTFETQYEAIEQAKELQLHVDNLHELSLTQYTSQEAA
jgi:hypothetical protein